MICPYLKIKSSSFCVNIKEIETRQEFKQNNPAHPLYCDTTATPGCSHHCGPIQSSTDLLNRSTNWKDRYS